ncbi:hypothetical protein V8E36_007094 [Tilletia maclaganii]
MLTYPIVLLDIEYRRNESALDPVTAEALATLEAERKKPAVFKVGDGGKDDDPNKELRVLSVFNLFAPPKGSHGSSAAAASIANWAPAGGVTGIFKKLSFSGGSSAEESSEASKPTTRAGGVRAGSGDAPAASSVTSLPSVDEVDPDLEVLKERIRELAQGFPASSERGEGCMNCCEVDIHWHLPGSFMALEPALVSRKVLVVRDEDLVGFLRTFWPQTWNSLNDPPVLNVIITENPAPPHVYMKVGESDASEGAQSGAAPKGDKDRQEGKDGKDVKKESGSGSGAKEGKCPTSPSASPSRDCCSEIADGVQAYC